MATGPRKAPVALTRYDAGPVARPESGMKGLRKIGAVDAVSGRAVAFDVTTSLKPALAFHKAASCNGGAAGRHQASGPYGRMPEPENVGGMRLYLSSYRLGHQPQALLDLVGANRTCVVIGNALDMYGSTARAIYAATVYDPVAELTKLGFTATPLDLRAYFGDPDGLRAALAGVGLVWVLGGNSFLLRKAMAQSGFDGVIRDLLDRDAVVYGGFSAGAIVAGPTLNGLDLMDDPAIAVAGYPEAVVWDGLQIYDRSIVPHAKSQHPESPLADLAADHLVENAIPFTALHDGQVIVVDGDNVRLLS